MKNKGVLLVQYTISDISVAIVSLLMICSMYPWFVWHSLIINRLLGLVFILCRFFAFSHHPFFPPKNLAVILFIILAYFAQELQSVSMNTMIYFFYTISLAIFVLLMRKEEKKKLVVYSTNLFAFIVGMSVLFYILIFALNINMPYTVIPYLNAKLSRDYVQTARNYIFLIRPNITGFIDFYRFQSIFAEPGHLGMISAFFLFINEYNFKKKETVIIFIGLLLSFSGAGYALLVLGFIIYQCTEKGKMVKRIMKIVPGVLLISLVVIIVNIRFRDDIFYRLILSRFEYDNEKGIAGNNREEESFDEYFTNKFLGSHNIIWGIRGNNRFMHTNSYRMYFMRYGLFGLISLALLYVSITFSVRSRLLVGMLLLYTASFLQRTYALWYIELFLFIAAAGYVQEEKAIRSKI